MSGPTARRRAPPSLAGGTLREVSKLSSTWQRAGTSKGTEMTLTDVARASLAELKGDYEFWLVARGVAPWKVPSPEARAVFDVRLDPNPLKEGDGLHESARYVMAQYPECKATREVEA